MLMLMGMLQVSLLRSEKFSGTVSTAPVVEQEILFRELMYTMKVAISDEV